MMTHDKLTDSNPLQLACTVCGVPTSHGRMPSAPGHCAAKVDASNHHFLGSVLLTLVFDFLEMVCMTFGTLSLGLELLEKSMTWA